MAKVAGWLQGFRHCNKFVPSNSVKMGTMATQSPFSILEGFFQKLPLPNLQAPSWAVNELQRRLVLLLNHVLMQEREAMTRLAHQQGQTMLVQWRTFNFKLVATPAGLLDLATPDATPDLVMTVTDVSPLAIAQAALRGDKPAVHIEGNVQLAAEVNWLVEHVRWDLEEDLARVMGDVPARTLSQIAQSITGNLRQFIAKAASFVPGKSAK
jgi:ubiquinone biosynthesis protein UbiJ